MKIVKKVIIVFFVLIIAFCAGFAYEDRSEIKFAATNIYSKITSYFKENKSNEKVKAVSVENDSSVINNNIPVVFVDRKYKMENSKLQGLDDELSRTNASSEGIIGKKVGDVYKKYIDKGYKLEISNNEIVCVKIHKQGKYVAKLNGDNYEIYEANDKGELNLKESGGRVNHKGQDEINFNKQSKEFDTIEEARESLADFTS